MKPNLISSNGKKDQVMTRPSNSAGSMNHSNSLPKKSKHSSVKSNNLNDVGQESLEKIQAGTSILHQAMKGNDVVAGIHKSKQQEKWNPKLNTYNKGMSLQILLIFYLSIICCTCYILIQTFVLLCVLHFHQEHKSLCLILKSLELFLHFP